MYNNRMTTDTPKNSSVRHIMPAETWDLLNHYSGATLIDVRWPEEQQEYGIPDISSSTASSYSVPLILSDGSYNAEFIPTLQEKIPPQQQIAFICKGGKRSIAAALAALDAGFVNVASVSTGYDGWKSSGLPVTTINGGE